MDGTRKPARALTGAVVVVALVVAGAATLVVGRPRHRGEPWHPTEWDPRVEELVAFVEEERGLEFDQPVAIVFLDEESYAASLAVDEAGLGDEALEEAEESLAPWVALGLVEPDLDVVEAANTLSGNGTAAYYHFGTESVVVRGTELDAFTEHVVVHELTHALQDQHFDLAGGVDEDAPDPGGELAQGWSALVEGDANRIASAWVEGLDDAELDAFASDYGPSEEDVAALGSLPAVVVAQVGMPYALGELMVRLLALEGGNDAVDEAFGEPPTTGEHLVNPLSYLEGEQGAEMASPTLPPDAVAGDEEVFGADDLMLVLASRLDPLTALTATDGWDGDVAVPYRQGDRDCLALAVRGTDAAAADRIRRALEAWALAGPPGAAGVAPGGEHTTVLTSCAGDGVRAAAVNEPADAIAVAAIRLSLAAEGASRGIPLDTAFDLGSCFLQAFGADGIRVFLDAPGEAAFDAYVTPDEALRCRPT